MVNPNRTGRTMIPGVNTGKTIVAGEPGLDKMLEVVADGPNPAQPQSFLLVLSGAEPGRLHVLDRVELVIGRSKFADIRISERAMSQQHAKIVALGDRHRLYDLGSTNGTFVNDQRADQVDLKVGDVIRTGETVFSYMSSTAGAAPGVSDSTMALPSAASRTRQPGPGGAGGGALVIQPKYSTMRAGPPVQVLDTPAVLSTGEDGPDALALLIRLLGFFRRYWLSIAILTVAGLVAGVGSYKFYKPAQSATFELLLAAAPSDNPVQMGRRMNFEFFRSAQQNFLRPSLIHKTLTQLGETDITPQRIRDVKRRLKLQQGRANAQDIYAGGYTAKDAEEAMQFLRVHLKLYFDDEINKALKVLVVEVSTLQKQLEDSERELNATEQAILAFKQENSEGLPELASQYYQEIIGLGTSRGTAAAEVARASVELRLARKKLGSKAPLTESRIEMARPFENAISDAKRELSAARASGKLSQHPEVIKLKQQIGKLEELRDEVLRKGTRRTSPGANPVYETRRNDVLEAEATLKIAQAELVRLTNDKKRAQKITTALPRLQQEFAGLTRDYEANQKVHANLFEKVTVSEIQLRMERASVSARYDIITPPNVERVSAVKTVVMRGGALGALGFFFGIALGLLRELRRLVVARLAQQRAS